MRQRPQASGSCGGSSSSSFPPVLWIHVPLWIIPFVLSPTSSFAFAVPGRLLKTFLEKYRRCIEDRTLSDMGDARHDIEPRRDAVIGEIAPERLEPLAPVASGIIGARHPAGAVLRHHHAA